MSGEEIEVCRPREQLADRIPLDVGVKKAYERHQEALMISALVRTHQETAVNQFVTVAVVREGEDLFAGPDAVRRELCHSSDAKNRTRSSSRGGTAAIGRHSRWVVAMTGPEARGVQTSTARASRSTIQYVGTPAFRYRVRLTSRSNCGFDGDRTSTMRSGTPASFHSRGMRPFTNPATNRSGCTL